MEQDEYCYKCLADIPVVVDGVVVKKKKCGKNFSCPTETDCCPECGNSGELKLIPKAFLVLFDTDERVRQYVTEVMEIRTGLDREEVVIAKQIIDKYSGVQEATEPVMDFSI